MGPRPLLLLSAVVTLASCAPVDVSGLGPRSDAGRATDASATEEAATPGDDAPAADAPGDRPALPADATTPSDLPSAFDAPTPTDAPTPVDRPAPADAATPVDASGAPLDAPSTDAPTLVDRPPPVDVPAAPDAGSPVDVPTPVDVPVAVDAGDTEPTLPPAGPFGYAPLSITERRLDGAGALINDRRTVYAYDAMRRVETSETQAPEAGGAWRPISRTYYRYDTAGRIALLDGYVPSGVLWLNNERVRFDYDGAGQRTVDHHEVPNTLGGWTENWRYVWEWESGRPTWRRFWQVPSAGGALYYASYQAYTYETSGRLRGLGRGDRGSPTGSWSDAGGFTYVAWPNGALRAYDFRRNSTTSHADYLYAATGLVRDVVFASPSHTAYVYDATGRLQFIRTYGPDGTGGAILSSEVEIAHTDAGRSDSFALDPHPYATWRMNLYGRGDVLDHYRR